MQEIPKQLLAWLGRLLPKQEVTGDSNLQVGRVNGNLTVVNHHQVVHEDPIHMQAEAPPPATVSSVLHLLEQLDGYGKRRVVLDFMHNQFGTRMVKALDDYGLQRTHAFALGVLRRSSAVAQAAQAGQAMQDGRVKVPGHGGNAASRDKKNRNSNDRRSTVIQNIAAPVSGSVAGRDVNHPAPANRSAKP